METAPTSKLDAPYSAPALAARIAVVGAGISGLVAASILAERGAHVAVFDLGRGPGGRMSQRREKITVSPLADASEAGDLPSLEARFDHGAQCFTVSDPNVLSFLERRFGGTGALAEWKGRFGVWDAERGEFIPEAGEDAGTAPGEGRAQGDQGGGELGFKRRWVGAPGMNALCQTLLLPPPAASASSNDTEMINARFGVQVARADWLERTDPAGISESTEGTSLRPSWELFSSSGESLGLFHGLVIAAAYRTMPVLLPDLPRLAQVRQGLAEVRASPRFAMMLAFAEPLGHVAFDGVDVVGNDVVGWIGRDSSKPGRARKVGESDTGVQSRGEEVLCKEESREEGLSPECWVVHSTAAYASSLLASAPPGRPSPDLLARVAADMWGAVKPILARRGGRGDGESVGRGGNAGGMGGEEGEESVEPILKKVHRWGGAFPVAGVAAGGAKSLWSEEGRVAACGDYCVGGPAGGLVEGAVASGMEAGQKLADALRLGRSAL
ncbi:hypothetical protein CLOM_g10668 [Closterium sp. NIES-68]|nr:hypothetical protein CLOM_g10668 [Closterium sp. NIES-68]